MAQSRLFYGLPLLLSAALLAGLATGADAAEEAAEFEKEIKPLLAKYCVSCHSDEKKEGELNLARYKKGVRAVTKPDFWQLVARRVREGEMPPEGSPQVETAEREKLMVWVEKLVKSTADCRTLANDDNTNFYRGYVMSRRLNRAEYNNSIRDLVGLDLKPADMFPADGSGGEGFDNNGDALFTSAILTEKYLEAATAVLTKVLPDTPSGELPPEIATAQQRILIAAPSEQLPPREAARKIVAEFARRAFRRPVTDAEVERLMTLFDRAQGRGDSFVAAVRLALKAVLISPNFLFLIEPEPAAEGIYQLGHYQLASRLSYFLWASLPDEELLSLAAQEKLHDQEVLRQQVRRMLADPRSKALAETFAIQWLGIQPLGSTVKPDGARFPEFNPELAQAMRQETVLLFDSIVREDRSLVELLDADYTFLNDRLAGLYGIAGIQGSEMRRVSLTDRARGGVLGMASVLTVTSYPLRTSPVQRGKWVLEELLGSKVPPPPPNAGTLPDDDHQADGLTLRKRLELHRSKAECASCHARMDPIGLGLENFDPIGRWRTEQAGQPVDASGKLPSGEQFSGPAELKAVLMKRKDEFLRNLARKMLGYALAREVNRFDLCVIDDSMKALQENNYKASVLIERIVLSYPFQYRYAKK